MHDKDVEELLEGHTAELKDEELVELLQSAEEEEGTDFAQPQLTLDNLVEGFRMMKAVTEAVTDYFYNIDPSMIRAPKFKEEIENSAAPYHQISKDVKWAASQPEIMMMFNQHLPSTSTATSLLTMQELPDVESGEEELDESLTLSSTIHSNIHLCPSPVIQYISFISISI